MYNYYKFRINLKGGFKMIYEFLFPPRNYSVLDLYVDVISTEIHYKKLREVKNGL